MEEEEEEEEEELLPEEVRTVLMNGSKKGSSEWFQLIQHMYRTW